MTVEMKLYEAIAVIVIIGIFFFAGLAIYNHFNPDTSAEELTCLEEIAKDYCNNQEEKFIKANRETMLTYSSFFCEVSPRLPIKEYYFLDTEIEACKNG
jgi:hypothetical protein